ncbi:unnamed protein product [Lupinus luteus]|uniref:Helitron helicase-like domain-containing protein n=1 Tax=Lupinus luteus TaxID=3873 RepID=A0AAV1XHX2_LUPLU
MEADKLNWVRNNQTQLRVEKYSNLNSNSDSLDTQGANKGKMIILPSSFVGGRRYMDQLYFDDMYTIEFQKRGLPHAHILLFLHPSSKYPTAENIDKIITAEIPNPVEDP